MKILYIVENAVDSGGNRVIFIKIRESIDKGHLVEVAYILRRINKIKDILGFIKDYIGMLLRFRNIKFTLLNQPTLTDHYDLVVTTGRRCLEFISDISSEKHIHLIQHLEAWSSFNSNNFLEFSKVKSYASSADTLRCLNEHECPDELAYIARLRKVKSFSTVTYYLKRILIELNPSANVEVIEPPEISYPINEYAKKGIVNERIYDLLFFIRGLKFKGDELVEEIIKDLVEKNLQLRIAVVLSGKARRLELVSVGLTYFEKPSDLEIAKIYSKSKILINPSLTEGYGAVPREAILYGCKCITSNTGWLQDYNGTNKDIVIVNKHAAEIYIKEICKMINGR